MSISALSAALLEVLKQKMPPLLPPGQIGLAPPDAAQGQYMLGIHLFKISEDPGLRLTERVAVDSGAMRRPPMCLELSYMFTAYAGAKSTFIDDYKILERVMQIFYDSPLLEPLSPYQPQIVPRTKIELLPIGIDEISKIWQFSGADQRLSLYYRLSPVPLGSDIESRTARVGEADFGFSETGGE